MQNGINLLWKAVAALFEHTGGKDALERAGLYPPLQRPTAALWHEAVRQQAAAGGLAIPAAIPDLESPDGRHGVHTPDFAELLAELTEVYRVEPGAAW
jgi:ring-1,2-phenylacetyl-CoA epoxidase subunit PaaC